VYKTFLPAHAITAWSQLGPDVKATRFALQYGYADIIAPFFLAKCLEEELQNLKPGGVQVGWAGGGLLPAAPA
jgi:predicted esterase